MKNWQTFSIRRNNTIFWGGLIGLTILAAVMSIWMGSVSLSAKEVFSAIFDAEKTSKMCIRDSLDRADELI